MMADFQQDGTVIITMTEDEFFKKFGFNEDKSEEATPPKSNDLEKQITDQLHAFGIPRNVKGFGYLREAITLCVSDTNYIKYITKQLYPKIAQEHVDRPSRVERAMRHGIELACKHNPGEIGKVFKRSIESDADRPCNSEFIATLADNFALSRA
jgi:two-component system response regulator (stage 0 sporulation protein A)